MPITIQTTVYKFAELSDSAKEKARDWFREGDEFDTEFLYNDFVEIGGLLGIEFSQRQHKTVGGGTVTEPAIYWSGFSSQGDGACFEGSYSYSMNAAARIATTYSEAHPMIIVANRLEAAQKSGPETMSAKIQHRGHYYHSGCMEIEFDGETCRGEVEREIVESLRAFADWMYRQLEAEYEYRTSDEQVDESIVANEYTFTESGKRFG